MPALAPHPWPAANPHEHTVSAFLPSYADDKSNVRLRNDKDSGDECGSDAQVLYRNQFCLK